MRAARFYGKGDIRIDDIPAPALSDGRVYVDVEWCGICGSDLHEFLMGPWTMPTKPHPASGATIPLAMGHELCGRVNNPPSGSRFKHGDAVMVDPRVLCQSCLACKAGAPHCCQKLGYVGGSTSGGFGERVAVEERRLYPLGSIPLEYAAVIEPLAVVQHAIKEARISDWNEKNVMILGGGPVGFALVLVLKAHGNANIFVSEPAAIRRETLSPMVKQVINPMKVGVGDTCRSGTGGLGVDVVFDCAGVPAGLEAGIDALRFGGLYVNVALWEKPVCSLQIPFSAIANILLAHPPVLQISNEAYHYQRRQHLQH